MAGPGRRRRGWAALACAAGLALGAVLGFPSRGPATTADEGSVKAAFLLNFARFVEWPASAFPDGGSPFVLGVIGVDPFGPILDQLAEKGVKGRRVAVRRFSAPDEAAACHLLFVSASERPRLAAILAAASRGPVLTVSDIDGFARRGGVIGFVRAADKIRFEIDAQAGERADLRLSSQLLKLALTAQEQR